ncbi:MAG TPA: HTH domain-containing protein [Petrimonas sp.]|uniref:RNA-binding domain-containing protein n=1 Tax=Petrimonas sp. TaxID=2023866 RepID=UPI001772C294|nr:putative DNA binding domain-containing protein [Petrimonas sp.]HHV86465.1 HTH domain-containing protein [Petrimonas sp.]
MITKDEIRDLLKDIENERVERTISTKDTDKFARAVCAFANDLPNKRLPGYLIIGAYDDGSLNGLKVTDELLRNLAGLRSDGNILPQPALMVEKFSFPDGDIVVVEVKPSKNTPVKYKGTVYIRIGPRRGEANDEELRILREKSEVKSQTFDTSPCLHTTIDDLDLDLFKSEYLPRMVSANILKGDKRGIKEQLASLKLFDPAQGCPTVAGILLIGKDPAHILFGSYIQYVEFAGKSKTSKVVNERQFSGNLITMLKEIDYFIKYTIQKQRPVFVTVLREEMKINYPYEAIRELAMNLIMHRTYETNAPARFYEYSDRIVMDNPGGLYGKVQPENFPHVNDYRNPVIAEAIFKVTVMSADPKPEGEVSGADKVKSGAENGADGIESGTENKPVHVGDVSEKRRRNVGEDNEAEKSIGEAGNEAISEAENEAIKMTLRQEKILQLIREDNSLSREAISKQLKVSDSSVYRDIEKLKKIGKLERVGGNKGGYWKIK